MSKKHREILKQLARMEIELARRYNMLLSGGFNVPRYSNETMNKTADFGFGFAVYYLLVYLEILDEKDSLSSKELQEEKNEVIRQFTKNHRSYCDERSIQRIISTYSSTEWMKSLDVPEIFQEYFTKAFGTIWSFL